MDGEIILAQAKEYTGFKPTTATFAKDPKPDFWERMANDPTPLILGAILIVAVIGLIIYVRRNKSA